MYTISETNKWIKITVKDNRVHERARFGCCSIGLFTNSLTKHRFYFYLKPDTSTTPFQSISHKILLLKTIQSSESQYFIFNSDSPGNFAPLVLSRKLAALVATITFTSDFSDHRRRTQKPLYLRAPVEIQETAQRTYFIIGARRSLGAVRLGGLIIIQVLHSGEVRPRPRYRNVDDTLEKRYVTCISSLPWTVRAVHHSFHPGVLFLATLPAVRPSSADRVRGSKSI